MSRDVAGVFADIDAFDPDKFVAHLTEDVVFRFGNAEPAVGRAAVREAVAGFFTTIDGLRHHVLNVYDVEGRVVGARPRRVIRPVRLRLTARTTRRTAPRRSAGAGRTHRPGSGSGRWRPASRPTWPSSGRSP